MKKPITKTHYATLASLKEGDVFELGEPFNFDQGQRFLWACESTEVNTETGVIGVRLSLSYRGVHLRRLVAVLNPSRKTVAWDDACATA